MKSSFRYMIALKSQKIKWIRQSLYYQQSKQILNILKPIRPGLFSRSPDQGGGGLRGPDAKNQGYYQPIGIKLCMSHYSHKSMLDAKFESGSFSIFGDMTSQMFTLKRGTSHRVFTRKWVELKNNESFFSTQN